MRGYLVKKRERYYAVIYEGTDPLTSKQRRSWSAAGISRREAERLLAELVQARNGRGPVFPSRRASARSSPSRGCRRVTRACGRARSPDTKGRSPDTSTRPSDMSRLTGYAPHTSTPYTSPVKPRYPCYALGARRR